MKIVNKKDNKIGILDQNIFINNKDVYAYYILESLSYTTLNNKGKENHIDQLENIFKVLATHNPGIKFSLRSIEKVLTPDDIRKNLIDRVNLWDPNYKEIPPVFSNYIEKTNNKITLLIVKIETKDMGDVENISIKDLLKNFVNNVTNEIMMINSVNVDVNRIREIENNIYSVISSNAVRASRELTFYAYVSSLYPSYEISYSKNSYVEDNYAPILGAVSQEIIPHFGYFEMINNNVELFNLPSQVTYGCIIKIVKLPDVIDSNNFRLNLNNLIVNIETIPKDKANILIKRSRADLEFEQQTAADAGARDLDNIDKNLDLAQVALTQIATGEILCKIDVNILVLANDVETLKIKKKKLISALADKGVIATISFDQSIDFVNNYVRMTPNNYMHMTDLRYPLSFQVDQGVNIGDFDSQYFSPFIGVEV